MASSHVPVAPPSPRLMRSSCADTHTCVHTWYMRSKTRTIIRAMIPRSTKTWQVFTLGPASLSCISSPPLSLLVFSKIGIAKLKKFSPPFLSLLTNLTFSGKGITMSLRSSIGYCIPPASPSYVSRGISPLFLASCCSCLPWPSSPPDPICSDTHFPLRWASSPLWFHTHIVGAARGVTPNIWHWTKSGHCCDLPHNRDVHTASWRFLLAQHESHGKWSLLSNNGSPTSAVFTSLGVRSFMVVLCPRLWVQVVPWRWQMSNHYCRHVKCLSYLHEQSSLSHCINSSVVPRELQECSLCKKSPIYVPSNM